MTDRLKSGIEKYANMLRQYLGPWGCRTRLLGYDELLEVSKMAFDVPGHNLPEVATRVQVLGTRERSARVREAIRRHWPTPNHLWPADAPVRRSLAKEALS